MSSPLLKGAEAADHLGTTPRHVRELVYRREIPYLKVGRLVRFRVEDLDEWLETRVVRAQEGGRR